MSKILCKPQNLTYGERISGSEAAAALGSDPDMSKLELWAKKTGFQKFSKEKDSERKRLDDDLKEYIAGRFSEETGLSLVQPDGMYVHEKFDFLTADPDAVIAEEKAALKCAAANFGFEKFPAENSEIQTNLSVWCLHDLAVTGFDKIFLALLDLNTGKFGIFEFLYDEKICGDLIAAEARFWNEFVIPKIPPKPDGSDSAGPEPLHGEPIDLKNYEETAASLFRIRKNIKELEGTERKLRQEIILAMNGNSTALTENFKLNFSRQTKKSVDVKIFKENFSEIYAKCLKNSEVNVLKISEI